MKVKFVSGMIGAYISADCYIDGEYFDFFTKTTGHQLINEWGIEVPISLKEAEHIESEIRKQFEEKQ